ncbi:hypothetical protein ACFWPX_29960 [Nocardia sp. NPDC058518]|uniref:hypothetical protein n=1 Tax=Nocardia sp. NPDC058518 TaxID=3346534 RepID=UPI00364AC69D
MKPSKFAAAVAILCVAVTVSCGIDDDGGTDVAELDTTTAPASPRWDNYRGVYVPFTADGPTQNVSSVAPTGYKQVPQGAVVAAMQAQVRLALTADDSWSPVARTLVLPGPGRDAFTTSRVLMSTTKPADPAETAQFAGFRVEGWSDQATTVWLATRMPQGQLSASPTRMVWRGGDWKVELPATQTPDAEGRVPTDPVVILTLQGYTEFHR